MAHRLLSPVTCPLTNCPSLMLRRWQNAVLPATADVLSCPELHPIVEAYNRWVTKLGFPSANHFIVTHYLDGKHSIGMHFDKPKSIAPKSLITVVKTGATARPFRLERLNGDLVFEQTLKPGTAVIMTLEANLKTKHGVPEVEQCGPSGSIVFRSISDKIKWRDLEMKLRRRIAATQSTGKRSRQQRGRS